MAAAAFVRTTLMPELSSVDQTYASLARRPANGKIAPGLCAALQRAQKPLELLAVVAPLPAGGAVAREHPCVRPAPDRAERHAEHAGGLGDGESEAGLGCGFVLHDQGCRPRWPELESLGALCTALPERMHVRWLVCLTSISRCGSARRRRPSGWRPGASSCRTSACM